MMQRALVLFVLALGGMTSATWGGPAQMVHQFAQIGAGGGIQSVILVLNDRGDPVTFQLELFQGAGSPLEVTIGERTASTFELTVPANATSRFVITSSSQTAVAGWAQLHSPWPVAAQLLFEISVGGKLVTQAAVESAGTTQVADMFVDTTSGNTGVALANPFPFGSIFVRFTLRNDADEVLGADVEEIPALGHFAKFVSEIFPGTEKTTGSLAVSSTGRVALITLQQTGLVLGTLPVVTPR